MEYPFKDLLPRDEVSEREGYYRDWTHIDADTFHQISELVQFIREKGYGSDTREAIAQALERVYYDATMSDNANMEVSMARKYFKDLASRLDAGDQVALNALDIANRKIDDASGTVTMDNLSQTVKEAMTGGSVPVVGEGAVGTLNMLDAAATTDKQSVLSQMPRIYLNSATRTKPNYSTTDRKLTFSSGYTLVVGKKRFSISSGHEVDLSEVLKTTTVAFVAYNTSTLTHRVLNVVNVTNLHETEIVMAMVSYRSDGLMLDMVMDAPFTIDGIDIEAWRIKEGSVDSRKQSVLSQPAKIVLSPNRQIPNYSTVDKKLVFDAGHNIVVGRRMFTVSDSVEIDFSEMLRTQMSIMILFNTTNLTYKILPLNNFVQQNETDVFIGYLKYGDHGAFDDLDIGIDYTVDGKPRHMEYTEEIEKGISNFHVFKLEASNYFSESLPAVGSPESEFDYVNDTSEKVNSLYNQLVSDSDGLLTRRQIGMDHTNTYPIYAYSYKPKELYSAEVKTQDITHPKIAMTTAMQGGEETSVYAMYHFMEKIIKDKYSHPVFEYFANYINFEFIPVVNPYGFTNKSYMNGNQVQIMRNYDYGWEAWPAREGEITYKGPSPASEVETQIMQDWLHEHSDAICYFDFHVRGGRQLVTSERLAWIDNVMYQTDRSASIFHAQIMHEVTHLWRKHYDNMDTTVDMHGRVTHDFSTAPTSATYAHYVAGIKYSAILEGFSRSNDTGADISEADNAQVTNMNMDILVNYLIAVIKRFE